MQNSYDFIVVDEAQSHGGKNIFRSGQPISAETAGWFNCHAISCRQQRCTSFFGGADGHIGKFDLVWALKHRKLAFPRYLVLLDDLDQDKINQLESGLSISDLDKKLFLHKKDQEVVRIVEKTVEEQGIQREAGIVFCRNIRHMHHLIGFSAFSGSATLVHSKMQDQERRENIRSFREGNVKYILVCDLFNEGIDIPENQSTYFYEVYGLQNHLASTVRAWIKKNT